jgi:hypothetical protein
MHILGDAPCLVFSKDADNINIEQRQKKRSTCEIGLCARVPALELSRAIKEYYKIPYKACCSKKMPADTMEAINRWYFVDYISFLTCTVIRAIPEKKSYEVQIKEGGMKAEYFLCAGFVARTQTGQLAHGLLIIVVWRIGI